MTDSIRGKIRLGYYALATVVLAFALFAYGNLPWLDRRIADGAAVEEFREGTLEMRRHEKNFFLYHEPADMDTAVRHSDQARAGLVEARTAFADLAAPEELDALTRQFREYAALLDRYGTARSSGATDGADLQGQIRHARHRCHPGWCQQEPVGGGAGRPFERRPADAGVGQERLETRAGFHHGALVELLTFGSFDSNHLSLVRQEDGALDLYHGVLRAVDKDGQRLVNDVDYQRYLEVVGEEVRSWSYMKFPFLRHLGPEKGWYRVGALARLNTCSLIPTPEAEPARREYLALTHGRPNNVTMCYHWARNIELLHAIEVVRELLEEPDLQGDDLVTSGPRREEAVGLIEAPRGTLFHHYRVNHNDEVTMCNLIVSTTNNNEPMNRAVTKVAKDFLAGKSQITEGLPSIRSRPDADRYRVATIRPVSVCHTSGTDACSPVGAVQW